MTVKKMEQHRENRPDKQDEISIKDIFSLIRSGFKYLVSKWLTIFIIAILGSIAGIAYSLFKKPNYTATCSFVLEENSKMGALGQYSGLASLAGIDISGAGNGIFTGDNILELYRSRLMIGKTLLTEADFNGKKQLLIDRYADFNHLREKWKSNDDINQISFDGNADNFNRKQDSLIFDITEKINKKVLNVSKPDKKLSIIYVQVTSKDELFAKTFTDKLVENVNAFYIQTKTKKTSQNVQVLQKQADSVKAILNSSISGVASAIDAAPNANPLLQTLRVPSQRKQVDVQASTAIYTEIVKNLEISKISLRQETPLIQVIDQPILPLDSDRLSKLKGMVSGFILAGFIAVLWIAMQRIYQKLL